jgi:hypothetical protein
LISFYFKFSNDASSSDSNPSRTAKTFSASVDPAFVAGYSYANSRNVLI